MSCHSLSPRVSADKSADNLMEFPLSIICCLSLVSFNNFSLPSILVILLTMCLSVFLFGFILPGTLLPGLR